MSESGSHILSLLCGEQKFLVRHAFTPRLTDSASWWGTLGPVLIGLVYVALWVRRTFFKPGVLAGKARS